MTEYECPECGGDYLRVHMETTFRLNKDGTFEDCRHDPFPYFSDTHDCRCEKCGYIGIVKDFEIEET